MERIKIKSCSQPVNALRDAFISFIENLVKTYLKPFPSLLKGVYHKVGVELNLLCQCSLVEAASVAIISLPFCF